MFLRIFIAVQKSNQGDNLTYTTLCTEGYLISDFKNNKGIRQIAQELEFFLFLERTWVWFLALELSGSQILVNLVPWHSTQFLICFFFVSLETYTLMNILLHRQACIYINKIQYFKKFNEIIQSMNFW